MKNAPTTLALTLGLLAGATPLRAAVTQQNASPPPAETTDEAAKLAKELSNPISSLISVPLQSNWDFGIGPNDATRYTLNVQPVIPIALSADLNLIVRTIMPIIDAESPAPGVPSASGLGDITQSFFFSPSKPTDSGWIWGVGPAFLYPSATDELLGSGKVCAGPTAVFLKQESGWTVGLLANQLWSFAGEGDRSEVNATFIQPFVSYTTKTHTTCALNTETTYDWTQQQWTVPLNLMVSQLFKVGDLPLQLTVGGRYYADAPSGGPDWGLRMVLTFLFPK